MKKLDRDIAEAIKRARRTHIIIATVPLIVLAYLLAVHIFPILQQEGRDVLIYSLMAVLALTTVVTLLGYGVTRREAERVSTLVRTTRQALFHVLNICKELGSCQEVEQAAERLAAGIGLATKAKAAVVWVHDDDQLRAVGTYGAREQGVRIALERGHGIAGRALEGGRPARNVSLTKEDKLVDEALGIHTLHAIAVPMLGTDGTPLGVLTLHDRRDGAPFSTFDLEVATAAAQAGAMAVINARLRDQQHQSCATFPPLLATVVERAFLWQGHNERVTQYALAIAEELHLDETFRANLGLACRLHDAGLDAPLAAAGSDDHGLRRHPERGAELAATMTPWKPCADFIRTHHERMDGRGYPAGLQGYDIPLGGRILALVEWWDEVTNPASPRRQMSEAEALEYLEKDRGKHFDPPVVHAFRNVLIRLNNA